METAEKSTGKIRGRPFTKNDPRICKKQTGRPPAPRCIADILRKILAEPAPEKLQAKMQEVFGLTKPITLHEAWLRNQVYLATKGDARATEFVANRTEGSAVLRVSNEGDQPFVVVVPEVVIRPEDVAVLPPHSDLTHQRPPKDVTP